MLCVGGGPEPVKALVIQLFRSLLTGNLVKIPAEVRGLNSQEIIDAFKKVESVNLISIGTQSMEIHLQEPDISLAMYDGEKEVKTQFRQILAARDGARIALVSSSTGNEMLTVERVVSTDTTASGGNASLLALGDGG